MWIRGEPGPSRTWEGGDDERRRSSRDRAEIEAKTTAAEKFFIDLSRGVCLRALLCFAISKSPSSGLFSQVPAALPSLTQSLHFVMCPESLSEHTS